MLECNKSDGREWIVHWRRVWAIKVSQVSLNEFDTQRCHCDKCCRLKEYRVKCPILMIRHNWFTIESSRISTMHSEINTLERSKKQEATMMTLNQQSWATERKWAKPHLAIERKKCMTNWGQKRVVCCGWANWWVRIPWCRWYLANCVSISVIDPNRIDCNTNKRCFRFNWSRKMDFPHPDLFSFESFEMFDTIL